MNVSDHVQAEKPSFLRKVVRNLFDVSPAALVASFIQFGVLFTVAWALNASCEAMLSKQQCVENILNTATGILPTLTFWVVAIVCSIAVLLLAPILWFSIPVSLAVGVFYVATLMPTWIGYALLPIGLGIPFTCWIMMAKKLLNGQLELGRRSNIHEL
ncbi:hypothetical protein [Agrobacterium tumefaciens]|uniref:hypothetical protein n=1 Tax=Agrobacterium tumefaciens TaxID=358 RepID=UPI000DD8C5B2|nr:hypothetical protein [Agrobacterium tumefaciens]MDP9872351.1 hypothetical protein [Agrobacterium tumefaciens]MDP9975927.1 hypothetical protein [Agrobacterium tumefaciens]